MILIYQYLFKKHKFFLFEIQVFFNAEFTLFSNFWTQLFRYLLIYIFDILITFNTKFLNFDFFIGKFSLQKLLIDFKRRQRLKKYFNVFNFSEIRKLYQIISYILHSFYVFLSINCALPIISNVFSFYLPKFLFCNIQISLFHSLLKDKTLLLHLMIS